MQKAESSPRQTGTRHAGLCVLVGALACLQPGIDPVFLTLLSATHGTEPADHGFVVGATQGGMALGSLLVWRLGAQMPRATLLLAALCAVCTSLLTAVASDIARHTGALLSLRAAYGLAMGMIYTQATSSAAAVRPTGAYGAVFLVQLLLASVAALALPALAERAGGRTALLSLALVPLLTVPFLLATAPRATTARATITEREIVPAFGWTMAAATFLCICATMMVWSFTGALAVRAGISEEVIGRAVALGSIAGALSALATLREKTVVPIPLSGFLAGLSLIAPLVLTETGNEAVFLLAMVAFNIGSTAIIIRTSGLAAGASNNPLFQRFVAATHPLGMICGPALGSIMALGAGAVGLQSVAMVVTAAACLSLLLASRQRSGTTRRTT